MSLLVLMLLIIMVYINSLELDLCNKQSYVEKLLGYQVSDTIINYPLPPRTLTNVINNLTYSGRSFDSFSNVNNDFIFTKNSLYFIDIDKTFSMTRKLVHGIDMQQQGNELFDMEFDLNSPVYCNVEMNGLEPLNGFDNNQCYIFRLYQKQYPENKRFLTFDANKPHKLVASSNGRYVAWIEYINNTDNTILRLYDNDERSFIYINENDLIEEFGQLNYVIKEIKFCNNNYMSFRLLNKNKETNDLNTHIYLYSINNEQLEIINTNINDYSLSLKAITGFDYECYISWVSIPKDNSVVFNYDETTINQLNYNNSIISVLQLPTRHVVEYSNKNWLHLNQEMDILHDIGMTSTDLYIIVTNQYNTSYEIYKILLNNKEISNFNSFVAINNTYSNSKLKFGSSSKSSLLYWKMNNTVENHDELRLLTSKPIDSNNFDYNIHCIVHYGIDSTLIKHVSIYSDIIVWSKETNNNTYSIQLMDYDKDNDGVFDIVDKFPLKYGYIKDSDNDSYADAEDIMHGFHDDKFMYLMWAIFTFLVLLSIVLFRNYKSYLNDQVALHDSINLNRRETFLTTSSRQMQNKKIRIEKNIRRRNSIFSNPKQNKIKPVRRSSIIQQNSINNLKENKYDNILEYLNSISLFSEICLNILTSFSIYTTIYPLFYYGGVPPKTIARIVWIDFFMSTIFGIDLILKFMTYDHKKYPTNLNFLYDNWYDIPAVLTDVPSTPLTFPSFLGLLKIFRLIRLYRRFTQHQLFVSIMVKKPYVYLTTFIIIILLAIATAIKILEQNDNPEYRDMWNVLWFSVVTVTTVGYGDIKTPKTIIGRTLTVILMFTGIGLVSTLSAFTVAKIVTIEKTEEKKNQIKEELRQKWELMRDGLIHIADPYNPIANVLNMINNKSFNINSYETSAHVFQHKKKSILKTYKSSTLNVMIGMNNEIELPVDKIMKGAGGKFTVNAISSQAELIRSVKKEYEQRMLLEVIKNQSSNTLTPRTRVFFLLRQYSVHNSIINFDEMVNELCDIIFEPPRKNSLYISKIFSMLLTIQNKLKNNEKIDYIDFQYFDPLMYKISKIDEHFERYGITNKIDYHEIITELTKVLIMFERINTVSWAIKHLEFKPGITPPLPLLDEVKLPPTNMPESEIILNDPIVNSDMTY